MTETIPPLPALEICEFSKHNKITQQTVDAALSVVYQHRPDLFARFAEKERENLGVEEYGTDFLRIVHDEAWKIIEKPSNLALAAASIIIEARRRARLMYGIPPYPDYASLLEKDD